MNKDSDLLAPTKDKYRKAVIDLLQKHYSLSSDEVSQYIKEWDRIVSIDPACFLNNLEKILREKDAESVYKILALAYLFSNNLTWSPEAKKGWAVQSWYRHDGLREAMASLPNEVQVSAFSILLLNLEISKGLIDKSDLVSIYNQLKLEMMESVSDEKLVLEILDVNDLTEDVDRHNPFADLLNSNVSKDIKVLADARFRSYILSSSGEKQGILSITYIYNIYNYLYIPISRDLSNRIDKDMFASQLGFILQYPSTRRIAGNYLSDSRLLKLLDSDKVLPLKRLFILFLSHNLHKISHVDEKDLNLFAVNTANKFNDDEIKQSLNNILAKLRSMNEKAKNSFPKKKDDEKLELILANLQKN